MPPRCPARVNAGIEAGGRLRARMPETLSDSFVFSGRGIKDNASGQMPKLMRCHYDAGASSRILPHQTRYRGLILRRIVHIHEQTSRTMANDLCCQSIPILDQHLGETGREIECKVVSV